MTQHFDPKTPLYRMVRQTQEPEVSSGIWDCTGAVGSPWVEGAQHGGPPCGLMAYALEYHLQGPVPTSTASSEVGTAWAPIRFQADLLRVVPTGRLETQVRTVRRGRKIQLLDCTLTSRSGNQDGKLVARSSGLFARQEGPATLIDETSGPSSISFPKSIYAPAQPTVSQSAVSMVPEKYRGQLPFGFHFAAEVRWVSPVLACRPNDGAESSTASRTPDCSSESFPDDQIAWVRMPMDVVEGEPLSPFQRCATVADFGNALAGRQRQAQLGRTDFSFINADVDLRLHRLSTSEWIAVWAEKSSITGSSGFQRAGLWDCQGHFGTVNQSILRQDHRPPVADSSAGTSRNQDA